MRLLFLIVLFLMTASGPIKASDLVQFQNGEVANADDINANFQLLHEQITSQEELEDEFQFLEQIQQDDGLVITKMYFYNRTTWYESWTEDFADDFSVEKLQSNGNEIISNALGDFDGHWQFLYPPITDRDPPSEPPPMLCPDGSEPTYAYHADYGYALMNEFGSILLSATGGSKSGFYECLAGSFEGESYDDLTYQVLEGSGLGAFSCIERIIAYGAFGGGLGRSMSRARILGGQVRTGFFDPTTNGLPGTHYIEISAPEGCIQ